MNRAQRKYIKKLKIGAAVFVAFLVLLWFFPNDLFVPGQIMIASAIVIAYLKAISGSQNTVVTTTFTEQIEKYPILKVWYLVCCIAAFFVSVHIYRSGVNIINELGIGKGAIILFIILLPLYLPRVVIEEYEKFNALRKI